MRALSLMGKSPTSHLESPSNWLCAGTKLTLSHFILCAYTYKFGLIVCHHSNKDIHYYIAGPADMNDPFMGGEWLGQTGTCR